jgi:putative RecB family exonuclease
MEPLSASRVQAYLACSLQYRFRYVDHIPRPWRPGALAFGTSIHSAVEYFHRERLAGRSPSSETVLDVFSADWYAQNLEPVVFRQGESQDVLGEKGRSMLRCYLESTNGQVPRASEAPFEVDLVDPETGEDFELRLRGIIDLIEADGTVVDLKTAVRCVSSGDLERHLQLSIYALVTLLRENRIPALRLDVLLKTQRPRLERLPTTRTVEDLAWTASVLRQVAQGIEHGHFVPNPSWRCSECEYFAHCQAWRA